VTRYLGGGGASSRQLVENTVQSIITSLHTLSQTQPALHVIVPALADFDGWAASTLVKRLAAEGLLMRGWELFNFLRAQTPNSPHFGLAQRLLDVYLCTTMISQCAATQEVHLALEVSKDMVGGMNAMGCTRCCCSRMAWTKKW
jgi:hypothetical protein